MGMPIAKALKVVGLSKHQYYYRSKGGKSGKKPSTKVQKRTKDNTEVWVANEVVVDQMIAILIIPELYYGYRAMTKELQIRGYIINHKKVYRLMANYHLLQLKTPRAKRKYVKYRSVKPDHPLQYLEMDIKFQWVEQHQRYGFILTVIDCYTRYVLGWTVAYSIKQHQVMELWNTIISDYLQPNDMLTKQIHIELRNDNDSRFAAHAVQEYFKENHIDQVFTHPYTPQENGHIESFHSILSRSLSPRHFATIAELEDHLTKFYNTYNHIRLHGSLDHLSPSLFWKLWSDGQIEVIQAKNNKQRFKSKIPHHQLSGNGYKREVSCLPDRAIQEVNDVISLHQPSVQRSPSVVSC